MPGREYARVPVKARLFKVMATLPLCSSHPSILSVV